MRIRRIRAGMRKEGRERRRKRNNGKGRDKRVWKVEKIYEGEERRKIKEKEERETTREVVGKRKKRRKGTKGEGKIRKKEMVDEDE